LGRLSARHINGTVLTHADTVTDSMRKELRDRIKALETRLLGVETATA